MHAHLGCLHHRDRLDSTANDDIDTIVENLLAGRGNRHHPARALSIHAHPRHADRQPRPDRSLPRDITGLVALLQSGPNHHVLYFGLIDAGAFHSMSNRMARQSLWRRGVEGTPVGFADGSAGGGDDDGVAHDQVSFVG